MQSVWMAAGGEMGLLALARARHTRVLGDEVVSHAFSHGYRPDHSERLAAYWHDYFVWATTTINRCERSVDDVPDGLSIPRWSWGGLVVTAI